MSKQLLTAITDPDPRAALFDRFEVSNAGHWFVLLQPTPATAWFLYGACHDLRAARRCRKAVESVGAVAILLVRAGVTYLWTD